MAVDTRVPAALLRTGHPVKERLKLLVERHEIQ